MAKELVAQMLLNAFDTRQKIMVVVGICFCNNGGMGCPHEFILLVISEDYERQNICKRNFPGLRK